MFLGIDPNIFPDRIELWKEVSLRRDTKYYDRINEVKLHRTFFQNRIASDKTFIIERNTIPNNADPVVSRQSKII